MEPPNPWQRTAESEPRPITQEKFREYIQLALSDPFAPGSAAYGVIGPADAFVVGSDQATMLTWPLRERLDRVRQAECGCGDDHIGNK